MTIECVLYQLLLNGRYISPDIDIKIRDDKDNMRYLFSKIADGDGTQSDYDDEKETKLTKLSREISDKLLEIYQIVKE